MRKSNTFKANLTLLIVALLFMFSDYVLMFLPQSLREESTQYFCILIPCIIYVILNKRGFKDTLRLNKLSLKNILFSLGITVAILPSLSLLSVIGELIFGSGVSKMIGEMILKMPLPLAIFSVAVTPAICEEVLLRGVVMDGYRNVNYKKVILINGLLFGLLHMNFNQFIYAIYLGAVIAYVVYVTKSIYAGMIIHFVNNGFWVLKGKVSPNFLTVLDKPSIMLVVLSIVSVIAIWYLLKTLKKENDFIYDEIIDEEKIVNWPLVIFIIITLILSAAIAFITITGGTI